MADKNLNHESDSFILPEAHNSSSRDFIEANNQRIREAQDYLRDREATRSLPKPDILQQQSEEDIEEHLWYYLNTSREPEIAIAAYAKSMGVEPQLYLDLADKVAKRREAATIRLKRYQDVMSELKRIQSIENPSLRYWEMCELGRSKKVGLKQLEVLMNLSDEEDKPAEYATLTEWYKQYSSVKLGSLIDGFLPEGTTILLYADGGIGKTNLGYDLAASIARGENWNGLETKRAPVLILQGDEPAQTTLRTFDIKGIENCQDIHLTFNWSFNQIPSLKRKLEETGVKFIVIDSLTSANRHSGFEEKDIAYGACLYQLRDIANETGATFLILHHENKAGSVRGTTALKNNVSEVWRLSRPSSALQGFKDTHRLLFVEKSRSGNTGKILQLEQDIENYSWENQGEFNPENLARDNADGQQKEPSLREKIYGFLALDKGTRYSCSELIEKFKSSNSAVSRELNRLYTDGLIKFEFGAKKTAGRGVTKYKLYYVEDKNMVNLTREEVTELIQGVMVLPVSGISQSQNTEKSRWETSNPLPGEELNVSHNASHQGGEKNHQCSEVERWETSNPLPGEELNVSHHVSYSKEEEMENERWETSNPLPGEELNVSHPHLLMEPAKQSWEALNLEQSGSEKHYNSVGGFEVEMRETELADLDVRLASLDEILDAVKVDYGNEATAESAESVNREFKVGDTVRLVDKKYLYDEAWLFHGTIEVMFCDSARVRWQERLERGLPSGLQVQTYELSELELDEF